MSYLPSAALPPAGILNSLNYAPTPDVIYTTASTSLVAVDATNLILPFVAPASGKVLVTLSAEEEGGGGGHFALWGLLDGSNNPIGRVELSSVDVNYLRRILSFRLTGLTPNGNYTVKWAHMVDSAGGTTSIFMGNSNNYGSGMMMVQATP